MFEVNVMSAVRLTRHYLKAMLDHKEWGRVVFVSSESGIYVPKEMVHYGFSKAALLYIARAAAEQTKSTGITVNSVLPGPTWVEMTSARLSARADDMWRDDWTQSESASERGSQTFLVELAFDEFADGCDRGRGLRADRGDHDRGPGRRRQHHQSHDRGAADGLAAARYPDFGVEALDGLDEFGGGARVQSAFVDDEKFAGDGACRHARPGDIFGRRDVVVHLPASTRLAMVTYLRPASWA